MSCPICGKDSDATYRPFCSQRCSHVDLGRWLNGSYAIETGEFADEADDADAEGDVTRPH